VKDKLEDAREIWETSQNPIIYTLSGIWDNVTGKLIVKTIPLCGLECCWNSGTTEEGRCIAQIRKLDPGFDKVDYVGNIYFSLYKFAPVCRSLGLRKLPRHLHHLYWAPIFAAMQNR
jgi:hypothetical protein